MEHIHKNMKLNIQSLVVTIFTTAFNIWPFSVQPTQCIYVLNMDLRKSNEYFPI